MAYVDLNYADDYVATHFLSTDALRLSWEGLADDDKEVLLQRSFEAIESLPFAGRKSDPSQPNAFPRCPYEEVPTAIKNAQVENAVALSDDSTSEDAAFYEKLWQYGVSSYSIGDLSEHTGSGTWGRSSNSVSGLASARAIKLLQPFVSGGYAIRGLRP